MRAMDRHWGRSSRRDRTAGHNLRAAGQQAGASSLAFLTSRAIVHRGLAVVPAFVVVGAVAVVVLVTAPEAQARAAVALRRLLVLAHRLVVALELYRRLHVGLGARDALAVRDETDLRFDLEGQ